MIQNPKAYCLVFLFLVYCLTSCSDVKYSQGEALYLANCSSCHMPEAGGVAKLYPALNDLRNSDVKLDALPCIIRYGQNKDIYSLEMEGLKNLSSIEINNIINYLLNDINGIELEYSIDRTKGNLQNCKDTD